VDAEQSATSLRCNVLQLSFGASNQLQNVVAHQDVFLQQIPGEAAHANFLQKSLACDLLILDRSPTTGLLKKIRAENKVVGEQIQAGKTGKTIERIFSDLMDVQFAPTTNQVEKITAHKNVFAEKIQDFGGTNKISSASGDHAVYNAANQSVELTETPRAISENILISNAVTLRWNLATGKFDARGPSKIVPLSPTNNFKSLLKPKP
jgi:hypothetical protein